MKKVFAVLFVAALSPAAFAECSPSSADIIDTALVLDFGKDYARAWVKKTEGSPQSGPFAVDGYIFRLMSDTPPRIGKWFQVKYYSADDCYTTGGLASAGWFVCGNVLKVGYHAMGRSGVAQWTYGIDGAYTVSGDTLTVIQPGKEPQVFTAQTVKRCKD